MKSFVYQLMYVKYTIPSKVTIYLLSYSFLNTFGDVADVEYWLILLESLPFKTSFLKQGCNVCNLEAGCEADPCRV